MEENIEVKDVQKTEYLDKNGLDMLWAKVKENTNNQVEVEYNRAKAKEDSLSQEIASVKPDEGKSYIQAKLTDKEQDGDSCYYDVAGDISFKSEYSDSYSGPITNINKNGIDINFDNEPTFGSTGSLKAKLNSNYNITMQGIGRLLHDTRDTFNEVSMQLLDNVDTTYANSSNGNSMLISQLGIFYTSQSYALTSNDLLTGHGSYKTIGTDIAPLENGKVPEEYLDLSQYAKKTDIPEVGTSDFVSKNADEAQIINSPLAFTSEVVIASDMEDENTDYIALSPTKLQFSENNYTSSIELNGKDTDVNAECSIEINADHGNPLIRLHSGITGNGNDESALEITNSGISISNSQNENIGPDKVFATNGSVADLAQYVKKSEITADGNVNDVQVNGVSVVENKIANIKPSTKESLGVVKVGDGLNVTDGVISVSAGNYLTYDSVVNEQYFISPHKTFVFTGRNDQDSDLSIGNDHVIVSSNNARMYSKMLDNYIELRADKNALNISCANITGNEYKGDDPTPYQQFVLNKQGVWLYGGDGNHVLTSNASTIDITQYALKSVYDEKIAALEARIAALEAKHVEV